jgi:hypothetical protein
MPRSSQAAPRRKCYDQTHEYDIERLREHVKLLEATLSEERARRKQLQEIIEAARRGALVFVP